MNSRRLTGKWYLKRGLLGYSIRVQTEYETTCEFDFSVNPKIAKWEKSREEDLIELGLIGINCV